MRPPHEEKFGQHHKEGVPHPGRHLVSSGRPGEANFKPPAKLFIGAFNLNKTPKLTYYQDGKKCPDHLIQLGSIIHQDSPG